MKWVSLLPVILGVVSVLQATWNRQSAQSIGIMGATVLNSTVLMLSCLAGLLLLKGAGLDEAFRPGGLGQLSWWHFTTGILGFLIIFGIPYSIQHSGALAVFVAMISAQIITSLFWDYYVEGLPVGVLRVAGAVLAIGGAWLANWKSA
ncbi:MAG TPA: DMT family transporter [Bdellovibrionales bacterium]|nr:DMT family transporter [Bdellovibrionales bacterium]